MFSFSHHILVYNEKVLWKSLKPVSTVLVFGGKEKLVREGFGEKSLCFCGTCDYRTISWNSRMTQHSIVFGGLCHAKKDTLSEKHISIQKLLSEKLQTMLIKRCIRSMFLWLSSMKASVTSFVITFHKNRRVGLITYKRELQTCSKVKLLKERSFIQHENYRFSYVNCG